MDTINAIWAGTGSGINVSGSMEWDAAYGPASALIRDRFLNACSTGLSDGAFYFPPPVTLRNCRNCGAPPERRADRCAYCGTWRT